MERIEFTEYNEPRVTNTYAMPIKFTKEITNEITKWNIFINANRQMVNYIVNLNSIEEIRTTAINWYKEVIRLAKMFYNVENTTAQINNNLAILISNINNGNISQLERTYITTFTNVLKYQKVEDNVL